MPAWARAEPLVDEAIATIFIICRGALMLFCRAALPLSAQTLTYTAGVIRRHRTRIGSPWRKPGPRQQALLALAYLRKGETFAELAALLAARSPKLR